MKKAKFLVLTALVATFAFGSTVAASAQTVIIRDSVQPAKTVIIRDTVQPAKTVIIRDTVQPAKTVIIR